MSRWHRAQGHHFDEKLLCEGCRVPFGVHQAAPEPCPTPSDNHGKRSGWRKRKDRQAAAKAHP